MMRDALGRRLPAPHPRNAPDAICSVIESQGPNMAWLDRIDGGKLSRMIADMKDDVND